jgi:hypothetical protein
MILGGEFMKFAQHHLASRMKKQAVKQLAWKVWRHSTFQLFLLVALVWLATPGSSVAQGWWWGSRISPGFDRKAVGWAPSAQPLTVPDHPPEVREGQPVFLVGYPTGLDAVVARLEYKEQAELEKATGSSDYAKALLLAQRQQLRPSITGGFLWEVLPHTLVYDAHTAGGSSGGPLLDRQGTGVRCQRCTPFGILRDQLRNPDKIWARASRGPWPKI